MVIDPVCKMVLDPASATATADYEGATVYFCSEKCHLRFVASPEAYRPISPSLRPGGGGQGNSASNTHSRDLRALAVATNIGLLAAAIMLGFYFGVLTVVSGWDFTIEQFSDYWPFIVALAIGFGIQVGLFIYLRQAVHAAASGKVIAATGTTSGAAMVSCCTHYLVNLLPALGATGLVSFIGQYQTELFWFGIAANLAGISYIGRRVVLFTQGA